MPELPDVTVYVEALQRLASGETVENFRVFNPFVLRTVSPGVEAFVGRRLLEVSRLGKRIVFQVSGGYFAVIHLMIAGRLRWRPVGAKPPGRGGLLALDFSTASLILTEAGSKRRASLHLVRGREELDALDPGGLEVLETDLPTFREAMTRERHTLKRALTDPRILSGIGNSYSDEILHRARLSPFRLSDSLGDEEWKHLFMAVVEVLRTWTERLRAEIGDGFPDKVTAFREGMAVHGRFGQPCPNCRSPVQRIRYVQNESNYCPRCQTGGRVLADRSLSRLLKKDWPRTVDELEQR